MPEAAAVRRQHHVVPFPPARPSTPILSLAARAAEPNVAPPLSVQRRSAVGGFQDSRAVVTIHAEVFLASAGVDDVGDCSGSMAIDPMARDCCESVSGVHVVPPSVVFHTPPSARASVNCLESRVGGIQRQRGDAPGVNLAAVFK